MGPPLDDAAAGADGGRDADRGRRRDGPPVQLSAAVPPGQRGAVVRSTGRTRPIVRLVLAVPPPPTAMVTPGQDSVDRRRPPVSVTTVADREAAGRTGGPGLTLGTRRTLGAPAGPADTAGLQDPRCQSRRQALRARRTPGAFGDHAGPARTRRTRGAIVTRQRRQGPVRRVALGAGPRRCHPWRRCAGRALVAGGALGASRPTAVAPVAPSDR